MTGRKGPSKSVRGGRAGASDVGHVPIVEIAFGKRLVLLSVVGVALELATSVLASGLEEKGLLSSSASHVIHVAVAFVGTALAFLWIFYRPLHAAWREREMRLRDLLRSRTELDRSLAHVFETMTIGLAFLDAEGHPVRTNRAFRDLLGEDAGTRGRALYELLDLSGLQARLESVLRGEGDGGLVARASTRLGPRMLNVFLTAAALPSGGTAGAFVSIEDQTALWAQSEELQKSEQFYRAVVEESRDMILRLSPDGKVLQCNSAGQRLLEALGERSQGALLPDSRTSREEAEGVRSRRAALSPEASRVSQSARIVLADGRTRRIEWAELGFFDSERRLAEIHVVGRDVTELAETRLRLEESEARYRTLFTGSQTALLISDPATGRLVDANPRATVLTGFPREELQGRPVAALFLGGEPPLLDQLLRAKPEREGSSGVEAVLLTRDGRRVAVEALTGQVADWDGRPLVLLALRDISRKQAEQAAAAAREAELRALFHAAPIGIGLFRERIFLKVNDGLTAILGYSADELIGRSARLLYPSDEAFEEAGTRLYDRDLVLRKGVGETTVRFRKKDGSLIDVLLAAAPFDPADPAKGVAVAVLDVTEKLALEAEMRKNDVLLRLLSGHAPAIFWTTDARLRVTSALGAPVAAAGYDPSSSSSTSLEELLGSPGSLAVVSAHHRIALETGSCSFLFERAGRFYDASLESVRGADGELTGIVGVAVDTTERRLADEQSRKRQLQLQFLLSIARTALGPNETKQILRAVAEEVRREFHMPLAAIGLVDRRRGRTVLTGSAGARSASDPAESVRPRAPLNATLAGQVVATGRTALILGEDVADEWWMPA
ncbi:MAG: PAS domain S-box protein [Holophagales bacterium]|nr:PAS domain S-box protein [Holophagales bacterium]